MLTSAHPKPLFIPLSSAPFWRFVTGDKVAELRRYGARWNEHTCQVGRLAMLSRGYSTPDRLLCCIDAFEVIRGTDLVEASERDDTFAVYGRLDFDVARIQVSVVDTLTLHRLRTRHANHR